MIELIGKIDTEFQIELRQLATFQMVATTLSFTRSAAALGYVQSSVTAQIQALEAEFGVPLFERLGKRVVGDDEPSGTLTISIPETLCTYRLPVILQQFQSCYPRVHLCFQPNRFCTLDTDVRRSLSNGSVDLAFVLEEPLQVIDLVVEPLVKEPLLILSAPDHQLVQLSHIRSANLEGEQFLLPEMGCSYRVLFERVLAAAGVHPSTPRLEFSAIEAIKQCVMAGQGKRI